jgi:hypothetical protein
LTIAPLLAAQLLSVSPTTAFLAAAVTMAAAVSALERGYRQLLG